MSNLKKIIAWILIFAIIISVLCVPAFASDRDFGGGGRYTTTNFF